LDALTQYSVIAGAVAVSMGDKQLEHKILAIVEEQGAEEVRGLLELEVRIRYIM
jgi:hypothetical protein